MSDPISTTTHRVFIVAEAYTAKQAERIAGQAQAMFSSHEGFSVQIDKITGVEAGVKKMVSHGFTESLVREMRGPGPADRVLEKLVQEGVSEGRVMHALASEINPVPETEKKNVEANGKQETGYPFAVGDVLRDKYVDRGDLLVQTVSPTGFELDQRNLPGSPTLQFVSWASAECFEKISKPSTPLAVASPVAAEEAGTASSTAATSAAPAPPRAWLAPKPARKPATPRDVATLSPVKRARAAAAAKKK